MSDSQSRAFFPENAFNWRQTLRTWRQRQTMTQRQLADRSGLAHSTIRAYERGRRHPSQAALIALVSALGIPREEANQVLMGAGYSVDWEAMQRQRFVPSRMEDLQAEAEALAWPAFITNQGFDMLHANRAAQRLLGVDLDHEYLGFGDRNVLGSITHEDIASRVDNWDELVTFICGLAKGDSEWASTDLTHPAPFVRRAIERLQTGDPERIRRFAELWQAAPPIPNGIRFSYRLRLRHEGGVLEFSGRMALADIVSGTHWNEWIPANASTWEIATRES